ncbi:hypothetical protein CAPTEDRAFT_142052 [Capitella teleta]|uniref:Uncharacterized protein n=1 Tax=Capitella teleta TaxID=283909 RepID=R7U7I8_CAPTE|nr:hypothetical protein CAPTEDRAFT_142052 [Capitella teleta]|eukprot:ELT99105.1 hypothetical protein CAPTEDRAFT_142052 [Capitella teleta]
MSRVQSTPIFGTTKTRFRSLPRVPSLPVFVPTRSKAQVPLLFREAYVDHGFRELHRPWWSYLLSVLQLHNESMNVWTHLVALVLMLKHLHTFNQHLDFLTDPYSWPLLAGFVCGLLLYSFSSMAHCFHSKSELVHYLAFMVDYAGIGLYGLGSTIIHFYYCTELELHLFTQNFFVPVGCALAFLVFFCCSYAKVSYSRPYPFVRKVWQMVPVLGVYFHLSIPLVHRFILCLTSSSACPPSIQHHAQQMVWFILSGIFYASDLPQRFHPGRFDHFFHSHQLFHICIMMSTSKQMDAVLLDYQMRLAAILAQPEPSLFSAFGPVAVVLAAQIISFCFFRSIVKRKLAKRD